MAGDPTSTVGVEGSEHCHDVGPENNVRGLWGVDALPNLDPELTLARKRPHLRQTVGREG